MKILITIPVLNEENELEKNIKILADFLAKNLKYDWEIEIADNGSIDKTQEIGERLAREKSGKTLLRQGFEGHVKYRRLEERGRGRALKKSWSGSDAEILSYMDVDLSTNLKSFPPLIDKIISGADVATGSRLLKASRTKRQIKREILSRGYNLLVKLMFQNKFSDAQCGFKAITKKAAAALLPKIENDNWFFDTELLLLAERAGFKIAEVPVEWIEDLDSKVKIFKTVMEDIKGLIRVKREK
jgi:glycosyltransferase involved in cell wall biosynthesis